MTNHLKAEAAAKLANNLTQAAASILENEDPEVIQLAVVCFMVRVIQATTHEEDLDLAAEEMGGHIKKLVRKV